ncbi:conserved Plasmodium protein, unknown function [Plasmodium knowlesi strain H]|uniref:Uncharacterized protein n=3 Tax=Plasmodium knowlesi TaxID=5850 RepID=A0A5K1V5P4_PLAKH|nr:conserved Plasmodium protein, unknown function [Plasmodium knowlesi strain H]OTN68733.1 Uncharacterized protein PKNOH_S01012000 [Plasmodium knowlesi]CAA9986121.1 conserved Plasmodium protein, unknown function [Plasmodium knowlesi strain H]SBO25291.1 conserved Plasmodium protein, unknown function [Plasmodium knowlesi strain H]SBO27617.1 conserved Plasmodium protein, unknown function [Plasmodium knowlesi strain H]VVS75595.1 conserved Plasmodium protein, unknown function [Plasmodium knowlesi s|eukprot:XP_002257532.1 hypothetical protein, conserved in Plasmodium species [Plasmodium knowlesi strain H]
MFRRGATRSMSKLKRLIPARGVKTSARFFTYDHFIFNFDDVENLKKLKGLNTEPLVIQTQRKKDNYEHILDQSKLKKTRRLLLLIRKKLINYEQTPLNRFYFIFYKNVDCLSEAEVIDLLYLAIRNRKYYAQQGDIESSFDSASGGLYDGGNTSIIGEGSDLTRNNVQDISDHVYTNVGDAKNITIRNWKNEHLGGDNQKEHEGCASKAENAEWGDDTNNDENSHLKCKQFRSVAQNGSSNWFVAMEEDAVDTRENHNYTQRRNNFKRSNVDYVLRLLSSLRDSLRERKIGMENTITLLDVYKLSYCLRHYRMVEGDSFIVTYMCALLRKEISYINQNRCGYEIRDNEQLNILLNVLIIHHKKLNGHFFNLLYDYLFTVLKKEIFSLSSKNVCLLLQVNNFQVSKYDPFFLSLLGGESTPSTIVPCSMANEMSNTSQISTSLTMPDVNYLLFYQLKNGAMRDTPRFDLLTELLANTPEMTSQKIQNVHLLSLLLLRRDYSKRYASETHDNFMQVVYHMYSYLRKNMNSLLGNKKKREKLLNVRFLRTFSLALSLIGNNLHVNDELCLFVLYLVTNPEQILTIEDYIDLLRMSHFYNFQKELYFSRSALYSDDKTCFYIYGGDGGGKQRYFPLNWERLSSYIYECLKVIYSFKEEGRTWVDTPGGDLEKGRQLVGTSNGITIKKEQHVGHPSRADITKPATLAEVPQPNGNLETYPLEGHPMDGPSGIVENAFRVKPPSQCLNKQKVAKKNKSYYMHILDILPSIQEESRNKSFYNHLLRIFQRDVGHFNLHVFDLDKILFTYSLLSIRKEDLSLNILNLLERVKENLMRKDHPFEKEKYLLHSLCSILLSIVELNLLPNVDIKIFEKKVLTNIHSLNVDAILTLMQYYILKGAESTGMSVHTNTIALLVLHYIKRKYVLPRDSPDADANPFEELKGDVNYPTIEHYLHQRGIQNGTAASKGEYQMGQKFSRNGDPSCVPQNDAVENGSNFCIAFEKINEDDLYEFLLLKFVFIYLVTHTSLFHDNIKYHHGEERQYRTMVNNLNRIILHLKTDFSDMLLMGLTDGVIVDDENDVHTSPKRVPASRKNIGRYKDEAEGTILSICTAQGVENEHSARTQNQNNIFSRANFRLLTNYMTFILKHDLNFLTNDRIFHEAVAIQHLFVKKFKSLYYSYKYSFVYRKLMLSLICDMRRKCSIRMNCPLSARQNSTSDMEKMNINEYTQILKLFSVLCSKEGMEGNAFYSYLTQNCVQMSTSQQPQQYDIILNHHLIYDMNKSEIVSVHLNVPFFNYIIPMLIETKAFSVAVQVIFTPTENVDTYATLFNVMWAFLKSYNYDVILIKRRGEA